MIFALNFIVYSSFAERENGCVSEEKM